MENQLIDMTPLKANEVFGGEKPQINGLVEKVKASVADFKGDPSTAKGRAEIIAMASKVTKSKTALEAMGKDYVDILKSETKIIDGYRRGMKEDLTELAKQVRQPVTDWEEAEKAKEAALQERLQEIKDFNITEGMAAQTIMANLIAVKEIEITEEEWGSVFNQATLAHQETVESLTRKFDDQTQREEERVELLRRREEDSKRDAKEREERLEREQKERDERVAKEAAEKAEKEAKEREAQLIKEKAESEAKAKAEAEQAEKDKIEAAERAEREKQEALRKQKDDAKAEEDRIAAEAAARESDKKHRGKINNEALQCFVTHGLSEEDAKKAVTAIASKEIDHVSIKY